MTPVSVLIMEMRLKDTLGFMSYVDKRRHVLLGTSVFHYGYIPKLHRGLSKFQLVPSLFMVQNFCRYITKVAITLMKAPENV